MITANVYELRQKLRVTGQNYVIQIYRLIFLISHYYRESVGSFLNRRQRQITVKRYFQRQTMFLKRYFHIRTTVSINCNNCQKIDRRAMS